ncbi:DNA methyltransferase [Streptomyces pseudogriseolus]|uniref:DNA methyltransferase n=1 Tax=Streptomyces pseudogriseolus TaxID=36817 RepID=UPI003FA340E6
MAHIDNLISAIKDPELREAIRAEYAKISKHRQLGLVFDRHQPESVILPEVTVRVGDKVQVRIEGSDDPREVDGTGVWLVRSIDKAQGRALLSDNEGTRIEVALDRVVATREFGDPIYPGLRSTGRVIRGGGRDGDPGAKPFHAVINAENHHALEALLYPYEGTIDAIYIDPPYNSGARDWKYNNNYIDEKDPYRHSKWLSFMDRRLRLAKRLLNPANSVLICAIDENELHRLSLLIEQIFPASKIQMVTVLINPSGASIIDQFARMDEHLLFVHVGAARPAKTVIDTTPGVSTLSDSEGNQKPFVWESFQRRGGNSRRQDTKVKFFPVYIDEVAGKVVGCGDALPEGVDRHTAPPAPDGCIAQWPIKRDGSEACWQLSDVTFRKYLEEGRIRIGNKNKTTGRWGLYFLTSGHMAAIERGELIVEGRDDKGSLIVKNADGRRRSQVGRTLWTNPAYNATSHGSIMLNALLPGRKFPFPKSLYAVEDALRFYVGDKPDAVVLDFFGGSGTTAHAVARLNDQDGGHRRSIIVTNNEVSPSEATALRKQGFKPGDDEWEAMGICKYITIPRITAAITGINSAGKPINGEYKFTKVSPMAEGFAENVEFFDLTYEDPALISLGRRFEAIAPLLWLKAGAVGGRIDEIDSEIGWSAPDDANYAVLYDVSKASAMIESLAKRDEQAQEVTHVFVVTDSNAEFQQVASRLDPSLSVSQLYSDYLRTFELNTRRFG